LDRSHFTKFKLERNSSSTEFKGKIDSSKSKCVKGRKVKLIRKHGYAYDDEEHALGLRCVAAAVYDEYAEPLGAISLAGPLSRLTDERIRALGPLVARTAAEITARMGGRWPHPY